MTLPITPMEEDNSDSNPNCMIAYTNEKDHKRPWNHEMDSEISGDHEWTEIYDYHYYDEEQHPNSSKRSGKCRECLKCGLKQRYGHHWGSRKKGGFESVEIACEGRPSKKVHQNQDAYDPNGDHRFTPHYSIHDGNGQSYHERKCQLCGIRQQYGKKFGSKSTPGYERINPRCGDQLHI